MKFLPLFNDFGVQIDGMDPTKHKSESVREILIDSINKYKLVLVSMAELSAEDQVAFSEILGPVNRRGPTMSNQKTHAFVSNARDDGMLRDGEIFFHSDQTYFDPPLRAIALYGLQVPTSGGATKFTDASLAYERLPAELKSRLIGLKAFHAHDYSEAKYKKETKGMIDLSRPDAVHATHPVVWTHPILGVPVLLVNRSQTQYIVGMDPDESEELLNEIYNYIEDPAHVYTHNWTEGDLLIWDNWALQHARTEWDSKQPRTLRRVPIGQSIPAVLG